MADPVARPHDTVHADLLETMEAGKRIVNEAHQVLGQLEKFSRVAAQAGEGEIGHLSIGVPGGVNQMLVETLRIFCKRYPESTSNYST